MARLIGWDTETHRIIPGRLAPPIVCHSFADPEDRRGAWLVRHKNADNGDTIESYLTQDDCVIAGANIAYDMGCLMTARPDLIEAVFAAYDADRIWDVEIMQTLDGIARGYVHDGGIVDPTTGRPLRDQKGRITNRYSLWNCVRLCLGRADAKDNNEWVLRYVELEDTPLESWPETARIYPVDDARNTLEVAEWQREHSLNSGDLAAQNRAALALHLGSVWGLRTDPDRVAHLASETADKQERLKEKFAQWGFYEKDKKGIWHQKKKPIQMKVVEAYEGDPPLTDTQKVATDRVALEESADEQLLELAEMSKVDKVATYVPALTEATRVPLNTRCNVLLATGRSSYEGIIQLMPRKGGVRDCFRARDGYLYSSVDYAAIEMSTLAEVCLRTVGFSKLADAINADMDPHALFAAALMSISYEEFLAQLAKKDTPEGKFAKDMRQAGKIADFGFPGMMGPGKLVLAQRRQGVRVCQVMHRADRCGKHRIKHEFKDGTTSMLCEDCLSCATDLKGYYLGLWDEMKPYWNWVTNGLDSNDDTIEQFESHRLRKVVSAPAAANSYFQGLAADGFKRAAYRITREALTERTSPLWGSHLAVGLHDESFLEVPEAKAHEAAFRQADIMIEEMRRLVPRVKVKAVPALMRYWYKDAEAAYDTSGRLIPWEPKPKSV